MMITPKKAAEIVRKRYPNGKLVNGFEFKKQFYVFRLDEGGKQNYDSPFFAVHKATGFMLPVNPMIDVTRFFKDMKEHPITY